MQDGAYLQPPRPFSVSPALIIGGVAFGAFVSLGFLAMPEASRMLLGIAALAWAAVTGVAAGWLVTDGVPGPADDTARQVW